MQIFTFIKRLFTKRSRGRRKYYRENKDKFRKYYLRNILKKLIYQREYYYKNRKERILYQRKYRKKNKKKIRKYNKMYYLKKRRQDGQETSST